MNSNYFKTIVSITGVGTVVEYWADEVSARAVAGAKVFAETGENIWVAI